MGSLPGRDNQDFTLRSYLVSPPGGSGERCWSHFGSIVQSLRGAAARGLPTLLRDGAEKPRENRRKTRGNAPSSKRRGGGAQRRREASVASPGSLSRCSCCPARGGSCSSWCFLAVSACSVCCDLRALASLALLAALASNALHDSQVLFSMKSRWTLFPERPWKFQDFLLRPRRLSGALRVRFGSRF